LAEGSINWFLDKSSNIPPCQCFSGRSLGVGHNLAATANNKKDDKNIWIECSGSKPTEFLKSLSLGNEAKISQLRIWSSPSHILSADMFSRVCFHNVFPGMGPYLSRYLNLHFWRVWLVNCVKMHFSQILANPVYNFDL
jgi:hypothetical protein